MTSFYIYCMLFAVFVAGLHGIGAFYRGRAQSYVRFRKRILLKKGSNRQHPASQDALRVFESGFRMDDSAYKMLRYLVLVGSLAAESAFFFSRGQFSLRDLFVIVVLFAISAPVEKIGSYRTPFGILIERLAAGRKMRIDREHLDAMTQLKNLCVAQSDNRLSGDYLVEQLFKYSRVTKPAYSKLLSHWRLGQFKQGCDIFAGMLNTKMSCELASVFEKIDYMSHEELVSQLEVYQSHIREERLTRFQRRQEMQSYIMYAPVIASAFVVILNFMIIVIWLDTIEMIQKI